jgi:isopentenyl diphosphate isomerase/L-lactate dehydrogenase-like FMN-dependent dehydrogenase
MRDLAREFFDALTLEFRMLDVSAAVAAETSFLGAALATPVMVAALSRLYQVRPDGAVETAAAARDAGTLMWAGIGSEAELEALIGTGAKVVKIVKPYADEDLIFRKLKHAQACGAFAVGMDVDFFFGPKHNRGFALEHPVSPKTSAQIARYAQATRLPFIAKGILSEQDAEKALDAGVSALVVSNHGGAVINSAAPPLALLPRIRKRVGTRVPIVVDGSVASGLDAFKALALGADAVCVGKAVIEGLSKNGGEGVREVLARITDELRWALCVTGSMDVRSIDSTCVLRAGRATPFW